jgi:hypothetical protein
MNNKRKKNKNKRREVMKGIKLSITVKKSVMNNTYKIVSRIGHEK